MITKNIDTFKNCLAKKSVILCIDYGKQNTGIAIYIQNICLPVQTIRSNNIVSVINTIQQIITNKRVNALVLGLPELNFNRKSKIEDNIKHISSEIEKKMGIPILLYDESFSTSDAIEKLNLYNSSKKQIKSLNHQIAAMIVLEEVVRRIDK